MLQALGLGASRRLAVIVALGLFFAVLPELAHAADDVVLSEIENWQAVFGSKHIMVLV